MILRPGQPSHPVRCDKRKGVPTLIAPCICRLGCLLKDKMRTALLGQIIADGKADLATANDNGVCVFFHFSFLEVLVRQSEQ